MKKAIIILAIIIELGALGIFVYQSNKQWTEERTPCEPDTYFGGVTYIKSAQPCDMFDKDTIIIIRDVDSVYRVPARSEMGFHIKGKGAGLPDCDTTFVLLRAPDGFVDTILRGKYADGTLESYWLWEYRPADKDWREWWFMPQRGDSMDIWVEAYGDKFKYVIVRIFYW